MIWVKYIKDIFHNKRSKIIIILLLLALIISPLKILGILGIIFLGAYILNVNADYFYKLVLSFSIFFALNTIFAGIFFVLGIALPVTLLLLLYTFLLGYLCIKSTKDIRVSRKLEIPSVVIKILVSLILLAALIAPVISNEAFSTYPVFAYGGDNVSHIELLKEVSEVDGYFYEPFDQSKNKVAEGLSGYPQGFHINVYIISEALKPIFDISSNYKFVFFFYSYSSVMYILLGWIFLFATKSFIRSNLTSTLPGLIATGALFTGLFFSLFALGSQSQIACMFLFLSMLAFLSYSMNTTKINTKLSFLIIAIILLAGISFTWLLLLPVAGLVIAICMFADNLKGFIKKPKSYIKFIFIAMLIFLIMLIQPVVQILYSSPKHIGVNEIGYSINPSLYLISILVLVALFVLLFTKVNRKLLFVSLAVPSIFSILVFLYQLSQVGEARYYLYKLIYVLLMIAVLIIASYLGVLVNEKTNLLSKNYKYASTLILTLICCIAVLYNTSNANSHITLREGGAFSKELSVTALGLINDNPEVGKEIITIGSCNRAHDIIATRLVGALSTGNTSARQALLSKMLSPDKESLLNAIEIYQSETSENLIIISSDYELQTYLAKSLAGKEGSENFKDIDFGHVPKKITTCPDAVR